MRSESKHVHYSLVFIVSYPTGSCTVFEALKGFLMKQVDLCTALDPPGSLLVATFLKNRTNLTLGRSKLPTRYSCVDSWILMSVFILLTALNVLDTNVFPRMLCIQPVSLPLFETNLKRLRHISLSSPPETNRTLSAIRLIWVPLMLVPPWTSYSIQGAL